MEFYIGQICYFGFNFAPTGWALCNGQTLPIQGNTSLFALIGDAYGGDGRTTFGLPDLRGTMPLGQGTAPIGNLHMGQKTQPSFANAKGGADTVPVAGGVTLNACICLQGLFPPRS